jgi:hypothetical protein
VAVDDPAGFAALETSFTKLLLATNETAVATSSRIVLDILVGVKGRVSLVNEHGANSCIKAQTDVSIAEEQARSVPGHLLS